MTQCIALLWEMYTSKLVHVPTGTNIPGGQILIVTDGEGYHQLEGQPREKMKKGDVIKCPPDVRHWHGATENSNLSQLYIVPNTEKGIVEWQEPVTDDQYKSIE